jgi:thiamine-monophosphate kinase
VFGLAGLMSARGRTIAELGEFGFLSTLLQRLRGGAGVVVGPGQDCAVIRCGGRNYLYTVDALVEGVHFDPRWASPRRVGRKSFMVNASDVAAMGGRPRFCVVSIGVPPAYACRDLHALQRGIVQAARACGAAVVGGNLSRSERVFVSIALLAEAPRRLVTRRGARPGDQVYVTGSLGDAALALQQLCTKPAMEPSAALPRRLLEPSPRLRAGSFLVGSGIVSAMIDVSDGLLQDLGHICRESDVGATIRTASVPVSAAYRRVQGADRRLALSGGEDYELMCTVPVPQVQRLEAHRARLGCRITRIGEVTRSQGVRLVGPHGETVDPVTCGFDHFRSGSQ